jgi:GTP cyclohydrolase I
MPVDREAAERAIFDFLKALGRDPTTEPELEQTPARVVEAFMTDLLAGYDVDPATLLLEPAGDAPDSGGIVVIRDIAVATTCPHHLMPALGTASVAYVPGARLLGIGTVARLVDALARRLTVQEAIGAGVVQALVQHAGARGAYCELTLAHSCLGARGARQSGASVRTVSRAGTLASPEAAGELALALGAYEATAP